jgi:hypothetical protein
VDSAGIRFLGDGEWQARKHGVQGRRQCRKVHLAMDTATSDIRAVEFTPGSDGDSPVLPELLDQIPDGEEIGTVTADGAYDTRRCHTAIIDRQATAIIPIRKNGRPWKEDCPAAIARNETLRATRHCGRAFWKRWTGYHVRSRIEAKMRCLKAFGERIAARDPYSQTAEIQIRVALMNRFLALGTAEIVRVASCSRGKGLSRLRRELRNNAVLQMSMIGRPSKASSGRPPFFIQERWMKPSLSCLPNQACERSFLIMFGSFGAIRR